MNTYEAIFIALIFIQIPLSLYVGLRIKFFDEEVQVPLMSIEILRCVFYILISICFLIFIKSKPFSWYFPLFYSTFFTSIPIYQIIYSYLKQNGK